MRAPRTGRHSGSCSTIHHDSCAVRAGQRMARELCEDRHSTQHTYHTRTLAHSHTHTLTHSRTRTVAQSHSTRSTRHAAHAHSAHDTCVRWSRSHFPPSSARALTHRPPPRAPPPPPPAPRRARSGSLVLVASDRGPHPASERPRGTAVSTGCREATTGCQEASTGCRGATTGCRGASTGCREASTGCREAST
eukprot:497512-Rhodomonas_salina.1